MRQTCNMGFSCGKACHCCDCHKGVGKLHINRDAKIKHHILKQCFIGLIAMLKNDFLRWQEFDKIPHPAFHVPDGVIKLMPMADKELFAYKYVNGPPKNPRQNKQTIIATGQLSKISEINCINCFKNRSDLSVN